MPTDRDTQKVIMELKEMNRHLRDLTRVLMNTNVLLRMVTQDSIQEKDIENVPE